MTASKVPYTAQPYNNPNWNTPLDAQFNTISNALGTMESISVGSGYALSSTEIANMGFTLNGSLSTNVAVTIPAGVVGSWIFNNATSGTGTVTIIYASGGSTAYTLNSSGPTIVYGDGTNINSAISGSGASYLPTSGGTLSGPLSFTGVASILSLSTSTTSGNPNKFSGYTVVPSGGTVEFLSGSTLKIDAGVTFSQPTLTLSGTGGGPLVNTFTVSAGTSIFSGTTYISTGFGLSLNGASSVANQINIGASGGITIGPATASASQISVANGNITVSASSTTNNALAVTQGTATFANTVTLTQAPVNTTDAVNKTYADTYFLGTSTVNPTAVGQALLSTTTSNKVTSWQTVIGPTFRATNSSPTTHTTTSTIVTFNTKTFDTNTCFNTSTYTFTPTVAGYYFATAGGYITWNSPNTSGQGFFSILKNGGSGTNSPYIPYSLAATPTYASDIFYLNGTGDYLTVTINTANSSDVIASANCIFSATFVHP